MFVKLSISLLMFLGLLFAAFGCVTGGILMLAFCTDALKKTEKLPAWIQHILVPALIVLTLTGVVIPPIMYFFEISLLTIVATAAGTFFLSTLVVLAAAISILPAN